MVKNHKLAKLITYASFSEIIRPLGYKAKKLYNIETYYASSQICSKCDYKNNITKDLNVREYELISKIY